MGDIRFRLHTLSLFVVMVAMAALPKATFAWDRRGQSLGIHAPKLSIDKEGRPIVGGDRPAQIRETKDGFVIEIARDQGDKPKNAYLAFSMQDDGATVYLAEKLGADCYWREEKAGSGRDPDSLELYDSFSLHPKAGPWKSWTLAVDGSLRLTLHRERHNSVGRRHRYVNLDDGR